MKEFSGAWTCTVVSYGSFTVLCDMARTGERREGATLRGQPGPQIQRVGLGW